MANNTYRQPYQQGPPPQQQHYNNSYDPRDHSDARSNQFYGQQSHGYGGYNHEHYERKDYQTYDNGHEQYDQRNNGQYQDPHYDDRFDRPQQQEHNLRQQRSYQYDDRYRDHEQSRPPLPMQHSRGPPPMRAEGGRPPPQSNRPLETFKGDVHNNYTGNGERLPKIRDRILQKDPISPMTSSWDNPFPTFPSKKKHAEQKRPGSNGEKRVGSDSVTPLQEYERPSTAHDNQLPRAEPPPVHARPHTSHSQRNPEPLRGPPDIPKMPSRQEAPVQRPHTSHSQRHADPLNSPSYPPEMPGRQDLTGARPRQHMYEQEPVGHGDSRPAPRRAVTSPPQQPSFDNYSREIEHPNYNQGTTDFQHDGQARHNYPDEYEYRSPPPQTYYDEQMNRGVPQAPPQRLPSGQASFGGATNGHRRRSSDQSYKQNQPTAYLDNDQSSYRGIPLTKKISPEVPNFDALTDTATERTEDHLGQMQQGQIYRKPTYQNLPVARSGSQPARIARDGNESASSLTQFSFNLRDNEPMPLSPTYDDRPNESQDYRGAPQYSPSVVERPPPSNQWSGGRPQDSSPNNSNSYAPNRGFKGNMPIRPGLAQSPASNPRYDMEQQGYNQGPPGHGPAYGPIEGQHRPTMPPSQLSSQSEPSRSGYDQRIQPRSGFGAPQQNPPRPATSNSGHLGPTPDYANRSSSDSFQRSGMQNPDSLPAHPAPFRPGLMQPTPPPPRPTPPPQQPQSAPPVQIQMHQRAPSGPKSTANPEPPVTIQELNALQKDYKSNSNNFALGLKFAKRLVEAAKVLASENGRADAKQTAKNRERYIIDAHKIVKRLCSSGYPEAMFYLADCHGQGMLGLEADPKEAFSLYQSAAKLGHAQAAYRVAVCCELGSEEGGGTRRDPLKAVQWYKRAATLGDTPAMYKMGMIQLKGLLGQPKTPREAITWLKRAAEKADAENPHALHELGLLYENAQSGDYMLKDEKYALQLFEQAADLGYKYSQFRLGSAYEYGLLGLPIDPRMSIAWYSRAAKQGEHQSEFALSGWYLTGSGPSGPSEAPLLQQSDTEAYLWARKAASSGLAKAEYAMGYYTEVGIGVTSNIEEAKRWYYRAAAQNHPKARERLEDLKKGGQRMQKTRVSRSNVGKQNEGECAVM